MGVDIGSGAVKVAEVTYEHGKPVLTGAGVIEIPDGIVKDDAIIDEKVLADIVRQAVIASGSHYRDAVIAAGGRSTFVREALFPVMTPEELKEAVRWDIEKYVPYPAGTYYYDHAIAGKTESGLELKVLLVAAPLEIIRSAVGVVKQAGLNPVAVDIESLAIVRAVGDIKDALLVDIGASITQITVFQNRCPVAARTVPIGGKRLTENIMAVLELDYQEAERLKRYQSGLLRQVHAPDVSEVHQRLENAVGEIAREMMRTAEYYKIQNKSAAIDRVLLTGGGAQLDNLAQHLELQIGLPVILCNPLSLVEIADCFDIQHMKKLSGQLGVAIGLSLWSG